MRAPVHLAAAPLTRARPQHSLRIVGRDARKLCLAGIVAAVAAIAGITAGSAVAGGDIYIPVAETHKIPDKGRGKLTMTVPVDEDRVINNMFVGLRVEHPQTKDLKLWLKDPAGTKAVLSDRDTQGANFADSATECGGNLTYLAKNAPNELSDGSAPYTGSYLAAEPLSIFDGESTLGDWKLTIKDLKAGNKGNLHCFVLSLYGTPN